MLTDVENRDRTRPNPFGLDSRAFAFHNRQDKPNSQERSMKPSNEESQEQQQALTSALQHESIFQIMAPIAPLTTVPAQVRVDPALKRQYVASILASALSLLEEDDLLDDGSVSWDDSGTGANRPSNRRQ